MTAPVVPLPTPLSRAASADLVHGDRVGPFSIVRRIGSGGSADVYEAEHLQLGRRRALKIVRHQDADGEQVLARFRRETRVAGSVRHRRVADVFDTGLTDAGDPYLVMELLRGDALDVWIQRGALPIAASIEIGIQLLEALAHVHAAGVVHRDVKPQNLVLAEGAYGELSLKLIDFGICRRTGPELGDPAPGSEIVGTPHYMAPELFGGIEATPAHDVYAAAIVLFECLAGRPPYDADTPHAVIAALLRGERSDVRRHREGCPDVIAEIVMRALARDPEDRYRSAVALRAALETAAVELGLPRGEEAWGPMRPARTMESRRSSFPPRRSAPPPPSPDVRRWHELGTAITAVGLALACAGGLGAILTYASPGPSIVDVAAPSARTAVLARADRTALGVTPPARARPSQEPSARAAPTPEAAAGRP